MLHPLVRIGRTTRLAWPLAMIIAVSTPLSADDPQPTEQIRFFDEQINPLLERHCFKCHSGDEPKGGLRLTSRDAILKGGDSGPAAVAGAPQDSLLVQAVNYDGYEMPPTGKLSQRDLDLFARWVERGLPMPAGEIAVAQQEGPPEVNAQTKSHWSFRPLVRPPVPVPADAAWGEHPIDAFIADRLSARGLSPNRPADRAVLIRRASYDLLGLPPTPEEVAAFAQDESSGAYERLIDRLLESPQYGEHWARYWLDLVRYAETNSYERDNPKPFVWRYRDYVIDAFNADMPYDRFIREQLAGDELAPPTPQTWIATGFYRLGLWDDEPADPELAFYDGLDDIAATASQAFLGLTMNCARCHDHKLDPIPQSDYYRFLAFFRNVRHYGQRSDESVFAASVRDISTPEERQAFEAQRERYEQRLAGLRGEIDAIEDEVRPHLAGGEKDDFQDDSVRLRIMRQQVGEHLSQERFDAYAAVHKEWTELRNHPPRSAQQALTVKEDGPEAPATHVLARGNPHAPGDVVEPGFPTVLSPPEPHIVLPASGESSGRRLALAEWIASPDNPLTARVMANRLWQWHFGRGIVRSTSNFGLQGDPPTHPQLLDWLAAELISRGWSLKQMHRLIMTSRTYQQASTIPENSVAAGPAAAAVDPAAVDPAAVDPMSVDPANDLFWRFDPRRLRAEEIRDSILAVNGTLNLAAMHGPSIYPVIPPEVLAGQSRPGSGWGDSSEEDRRRRSVYIHIKRSLPVPILAAFDVADTDSPCPARFATTQPTQALGMLNSTFANEQAAEFGRYLRAQAGDDRPAQVRLAIERTTQRAATDAEIDRGLALIETFERAQQMSAEEALRYFCLVALNLNEFVYLD